MIARVSRAANQVPNPAIDVKGLIICPIAVRTASTTPARTSRAIHAVRLIALPPSVSPLRPS